MKNFFYRFASQIKAVFGVIVASGIVIWSLPANAATGFDQPAPQAQVSSVTGVLCYMTTIFDVIFWFLMGLSTIMILIAAFNYVSANGESEKVDRARKIITYAAIGIAVALVAFEVPNIVASFFGQSTRLEIC